MHRKDFRLLADEFKDTIREDRVAGRIDRAQFLVEFAAQIADLLARHHAHFDKDRFLRAAGVPQ